MWRGLLIVALRQLLARAGAALSPERRASTVGVVLLLVGLVVQVVLASLAGYLVDLSLSLVELWADLARKHLEITL